MIEYDSYLLPFGTLKKQSKLARFLEIISLQTCALFVHTSQSKRCFAVPGAWQENRFTKIRFQWFWAFSLRWSPLVFVHPYHTNCIFLVQGRPEKHPALFMSRPSDCMALSVNLWYPSHAKAAFLETREMLIFWSFKAWSSGCPCEFVYHSQAKALFWVSGPLRKFWMFDLGQALASQLVWSSTIEVVLWGRFIKFVVSPSIYEQKWVTFATAS